MCHSQDWFPCALEPLWSPVKTFRKSLMLNITQGIDKASEYAEDRVWRLQTQIEYFDHLMNTSNKKYI